MYVPSTRDGQRHLVVDTKEGPRTRPEAWTTLQLVAVQDDESDAARLHHQTSQG